MPQPHRVAVTNQLFYQTKGSTAGSNANDASFQLNNSKSQHSLISTQTLGMSNPLLDKQIKEINKQKEFLLKLQQDKEALERHMRENEAVMATRMQKIAEEKHQMESKIQQAAVCIQRHARGMIARFAYKRYMEDLRKREKQKLSNMLKDL